MQVDLRKPSELTDAERGAWRAFLAAEPTLASPYFALEFAECCEEARDDTRVLVVREAGVISGFLPFQAGRLGFARPLAGPLGDVQGVIAPRVQTPDPARWLALARVPVFEFHNALASQAGFARAGGIPDGSWIIDVADGFDAWQASRKSINAKAMRNIATRLRRLEEVDGGYSFKMADYRPEVFETMIRLKRDQYRRTGVFDVFSVDWTGKLLKAILRRQTDQFSGVCSSLSVGGQIVAVHVGMASDRMCHYWFPAYEPDHSRLSPGVLLLVEMARTACAFGHLGVELGTGDYGFKKDLATSQTGLVSGRFTTGGLRGNLVRAAQGLSRACRKAPIGPARHWPEKALRKVGRLTGFMAI
ncbi:GNAT family N-acetyltransferase [Maricaulis maris]|jgi:CelD/BcsL family acetyltransferase involved in cellulose biosynthesis|uniref:Cellulose biosynthetic (CelD)-like protein n=1 Tax=Maricaulis maris (strain MCS10) TaxID=394221 RepID=Q0AP12_MARMM|nr:GNAT family N-acetyltransferase [Maricaulis maris]ABI65975.1 cellulose biosynthetic (CelD)-like protein [Maricaulis maris MCS10]